MARVEALLFHDAVQGNGLVQTGILKTTVGGTKEPVIAPAAHPATAVGATLIVLAIGDTVRVLAVPVDTLGSRLAIATRTATAVCTALLVLARIGDATGVLQTDRCGGTGSTLLLARSTVGSTLPLGFAKGLTTAIIGARLSSLVSHADPVPAGRGTIPIAVPQIHLSIAAHSIPTPTAVRCT